jgi:hypothetical protein
MVTNLGGDDSNRGQVLLRAGAKYKASLFHLRGFLSTSQNALAFVSCGLRCVQWAS